MTACSFGGASSLKVSNLNLGSDRIRFTLHPLHGTAIRTPIRYDRLKLSQRWEKALIGCRCSSSEDKSKLETEDVSEEKEDDSEEAKSCDDGSEEAEFCNTRSNLIPNSLDVESLLTQICDTTSIAEVEVKLGGFRLYVMRDLLGKSETSSPTFSTSVINTTVETSPDQNGFASSPSLAISKVEPSSGGIQTFLDKAADEGLVILQSPRVGYFKRSRTIKGKRAPPSCKEKQTVKEGQVVCYIEQLGGELPIESDIAGEVIKILREDGDPVGYGDALIVVLPSFPGIKKLQ